MNRVRFGIKLWSSNSALLSEAEKLIQDGVFHYIELAPIPAGEIEPFLHTNVPYVIHATSERYDVNIADRKKREFNLRMVRESLEWADKLDARYIILHPGFGSIRDATEFLHNIDDRRIMIENMPRVGLNEERMIGYSSEQIRKLMGGKFGFCLDLNHAMKAAIALNRRCEQFVRELLVLNPAIFHISDGRLDNNKDEHLAIGKGGYDIRFLMHCVQRNENEHLTLETPRTLTSLEEDKENLERLLRY